MDITKIERLIERMEVQAKLTWNKEVEFILDKVSDQDAPLRILEIGSGPGVITKKLCEVFPNATIDALEIDDNFLEYSKQNLGAEYSKRVQISKGDIVQDDLKEEEYDIVYARLVLQHVHGVDEAIKNVRGALKKDGVFLITDVDEGLFGIIDPPIPELSYVFGKHIEEQVIEGGDRFIGRKLWRKLAAENFSKIDLELLPVNSDEVGIKAFIPQVDYGEMETMVDNELITNEDIQKIKSVADQFLNSEYPFALLVLFFVTGTK